MRILLFSVCFASLLLACGGSSAPETETAVANPEVQEQETPPQETAEEKFARQQADAVDKM